VALRDLLGALQQGGRRDLLDVAGGDAGLAVAGEDYFTLLGEFEPAVDRTAGLGEHRPVRRAPAPPERAAAAVEEGERDVVALCPCGDLLLGLIQRERRGDRPDVLGGV